MKTFLTTFLLLILFLSRNSFGQVKTIHVFVALCDNEFQGIVPNKNIEKGLKICGTIQAERLKSALVELQEKVMAKFIN